MNFTTELKVPPDSAFGPLVEHVVADASRRAELDALGQQEASDAARLAFDSIVESAMTEGEAPVRVVAANTPAHLRLSFFQRGMPVDDALARRDPRWNEIVQRVDEAHWRSHGSAGCELRMLLTRPHPMSRGEHAEAQREHEPEGEVHDVALAPPQEYVVRRFQPEDAEGIARAFYLAYGYHYDLPAVYVPSRLRDLNALGKYVSIVAIAQNDEIVGHYALSREHDDDPIADGGGAIVLPAHRGRDLLNRLRREAESEAERMGLAAYYTEPVTDHGRTQHASESFGAKACGITLGEAPRGFLATHMDLSATAQRQSFMLYVKPLQARARRTIYPPQRHREIVERIYAQLDLPVEMRSGTPTQGRGEFHTTITRADEIAAIAVESAQSQTGALVAQAVEDVRSMHRLGAIYAWLSLEDPGTPALCEALESSGFFFSGVGPWMLNGQDALRLQMPLTPIDLSALTVVGAFGKELLAYVAAERARVGA